MKRLAKPLRRLALGILLGSVALVQVANAQNAGQAENERCIRVNLIRAVNPAPPMHELKAAAIQFQIDTGKSIDDYLEKCRQLVDEAARQGNQLVVFPELTTLDMVSYRRGAETEAAQMNAIARQYTAQIFEQTAEWARQKNIAILAGSSGRETPNGIVNTAMLVLPDGRRFYQDKLFLTPDEVQWGWTTGNELKVFETPWGKTAILICYDSQFPALSQALAQHGVDVILIPSMTSGPGINRVRWAAQARSVEHHAYVVTTGTVSPPGRSNFSGQAAFITPQEVGYPGILKQGTRDQADLVSATFNLDQLRRSKQNTGIYAGRDTGKLRVPFQIVEDAP
jgi:predicted amidohydrolase